MNALKTAWNNGDATLGLWLSSDHPAGAEVLGDLDFDYINVDMQHGTIDYATAVPVMRSLQNSSATLTCRVPWNEPGIIGKALDAGAMAIIIPMVNTVAEAEAATRACRYPPEGARSYGPIRAARLFDGDYGSEANAHVACIPMIETAQAVENLDAILDVPGIDAVYVGPADLSISLGLPPGSDNADQRFQDALTKIVAACKQRGIAAGIHSTPTLAPIRLQQGFQMVTVQNDLGALVSGAVSALKKARTAPGGDSSDEKMY